MMADSGVGFDIDIPASAPRILDFLLRSVKMLRVAQILFSKNDSPKILFDQFVK